MNHSINTLNHIIEIAQDVNLLNEAAQLSFIEQRANNSNCNLVLPLVGEFSAGKTALINALTDGRNLETATKPTTSTIYEIHFGADKCHAEICDENGEITQVDDISTLKNANLKDSAFVKVFDTSTRVPSGIVFVDTPGLSSPDTKHKQTLINFLPKADGILLVTDINQQITRSLTDFIKDMELARRPVFLVITKCDTKAPGEIESVKKYIAQNCELPLSKVVCVSATNGEIDELCTLIQSIQNEKSKILAQVDGQRVQAIIRLMIAHIDEMLKTSSSDTELEQAIHQKEVDLRRMERSIERIILSAENDIKDEEHHIIKQFRESVFERLDAVVTQRSLDYNANAITVIDSMTSIYLNEFKSNIRNIIKRKCHEQSQKEDSLPIQSLLSIDLSQISCEDLSFNLDLNSLGHEHDAILSTGITFLLQIPLFLINPTNPHIKHFIDIIKKAKGIQNKLKVLKAIDKTTIKALTDETRKQTQLLQSVNTKLGNQMGNQGGLIETVISKVTDKVIGKPQRHKAIHSYIDDNLLPEFTITMRHNSDLVIAEITDTIQKEAEITLTSQKEAFSQLLAERKESQEAYHQRIEMLQQYKADLLKELPKGTM